MAWRSTPLVPRTTAERLLQAFEHGALFDVQFEKGGGVVLLARGFGEAIHLDAAAAQGVVHADAVFIGADAIRGDGVGAGEGGGSEQAAAETRAFFVGEIHQADGDRRASFVLF